MFGRLLGALLGFAVGRVFGAILGFLMGWWFDALANERAQAHRADKAQRAEKTAKNAKSVRTIDEIYTFFDVSPADTDRVIKKAYHRKMKACHPDRVASQGEAARQAAKEASQEVQDLYEKLMRHRAQNGAGQ